MNFTKWLLVSALSMSAMNACDDCCWSCYDFKLSEQEEQNLEVQLQITKFFDIMMSLDSALPNYFDTITSTSKIIKQNENKIIVTFENNQEITCKGEGYFETDNYVIKYKAMGKTLLLTMEIK